MKPIRFLFLIVLSVLAVHSFADNTKMISGPLTPAAQGMVDYQHDRNGNVAIDINVKHLASPQQLTPAKNYYVVWVQAPGKDPENKGSLAVNSNLEGSIKTVTPYQQFTVFVTAEDTPGVQTPAGPQVLKAEVNAR